MFLLIVVIVPALPLGCRQHCLPPRLCCSSVGVAFLSSSVKCSPPSSSPVGRQRCLPPCPCCPPPAVFCPCPVLAVLASRLVGGRWAKLGPPPPCLLSSCRCKVFLRVLVVLRQTPTPLFLGRRQARPKNLPNGRHPLGCLFALSKPIG